MKKNLWTTYQLAPSATPAYFRDAVFYNSAQALNDCTQF